MTERCEPADTTKNGRHYIAHQDHEKAFMLWWNAADQFWSQFPGDDECYLLPETPGYRCLFPVPDPAAVSALVKAARDANSGLRASDNIYDRQRVRKLDAALALFSETNDDK